MTTPPEIRCLELTIEDVHRELVVDLNRLLPQLSSSAPPVTQGWLDYMFTSGTRMFGAFHGPRLVGVTLLSPMVILVGQKDWIEDVVVDADYRRMGIAQRLMDMAEEISRQRHPKHINLTSTPDRGGARTMYEGRGYKLRRTGVYRKTFDS